MQTCKSVVSDVRHMNASCVIAQNSILRSLVKIKCSHYFHVDLDESQTQRIHIVISVHDVIDVFFK